jgi:hypothetical protein
MTKISSKSTFVYKRIFPLFWFGFLAVFLAISLFGEAAQRDWIFVVVPCVMAGFGFVLFRRLLWNLADEVFDCGDYLLVKYRGAEERIPLFGIMNVSASTNTNPPRITLRLVNSGKFGTEVAFTPQRPFTLNPFAKSPVAEDLISRVYQARTSHAP